MCIEKSLSLSSFELDAQLQLQCQAVARLSSFNSIVQFNSRNLCEVRALLGCQEARYINDERRLGQDVTFVRGMPACIAQDDCLLRVVIAVAVGEAGGRRDGKEKYGL
jgi:hypothetical protein